MKTTTHSLRKCVRRGFPAMAIGPVLLILIATGARGADTSAEPGGIDTVYLTWQNDPATTMTVHWHGQDDSPGTVRYAPDAGATETTAWKTARSRSHDVPLAWRRVHVAELTGLEPDTAYTFTCGHNADGVSRAYRFRTAPDDDTPFAFVEGGDVGVDPAVVPAMHRAAAAEDPLFSLIGGDIAYAERTMLDRWDQWFDDWMTFMTRPDGRLIPLVLAIGNHDVVPGPNGGYERTLADAPFFTAFFAQNFADGATYKTLRFGTLVELILLDSAHATPIAGRQTEWLEKTLSQPAKTKYRLACYHVPAYPAAKDFNRKHSVAVREHWVPLFDRYGVDVCFEHDTHTYKRTHRLRAGRPSLDGTLYVGDGTWGAHARTPSRTVKEQRFFARMHRTHHVLRVDVGANGLGIVALDPAGHAFDAWPEHHPRAREASRFGAFYSALEESTLTPERVRSTGKGRGELALIVQNPFLGKGQVEIRVRALFDKKDRAHPGLPHGWRMKESHSVTLTHTERRTVKIPVRLKAAPVIEATRRKYRSAIEIHVTIRSGAESSHATIEREVTLRDLKERFTERTDLGVPLGAAFRNGR